MFALAMAMTFGFVCGANADDYARSANLYRRASTTQKSRSRGTVVTNNFYYNQSNQRKYGRTSNENAQPVRQQTYSAPANNYESNYNDSFGVDSYTEKSYNNQRYTERSETRRVSQERKYFLAHPFFQPLKGNVGSVTDVAFSKNSFDFDLLNGTVWDLEHPVDGVPPIIAQGDILNGAGKAQTNQFLVKQDFSFGLTDKLAVVAMAQYDYTKVKLYDWESGASEIKDSDSGLNIFGFGLQTRFVDTSNFIGMASVYYECQRETSDSVLADLKLGYKVDRTTLYLVGRGGYSVLKNKGSSYGVYLDDSTGDYLMLSYKNDVDSLFYGEGGLGLFTVLNRYITVNAEAFYGSYDWHNQLSAKIALGLQPFDSFALNLYASGVLYDSADGKTRTYMNYDVNPEDYSATNLAYVKGDYKLTNYNEYKLGVQLIFHF